MKAPTKTQKLKTKAVAHVPANRDECSQDIMMLGSLQRELARTTADLNDQVAVLTAARQPYIDELRERINVLQQGVQTWCEANRTELTDGGKTKTVNLVTGEVNWRQVQPSCQIRNAAAVVETLERMGLTRFIRTKQEPNKEAMLEEPDAVRGISGVNFITGTENFTITPFEVEAPKS